jgi:hypothetical protein
MATAQLKLTLTGDTTPSSAGLYTAGPLYNNAPTWTRQTTPPKIVWYSTDRHRYVITTELGGGDTEDNPYWLSPAQNLLVLGLFTPAGTASGNTTVTKPTKPQKSETTHWTTHPEPWTILQANHPKPPTPLIAQAFTSTIRKLADSWRTIPAWNKQRLSNLSVTEAFGRPDRPIKKRSSWRAFISDVFSIPYFGLATDYVLDQTTSRYWELTPTLDIDTTAQTATFTVQYYAAQPPDSTTQVVAYQIHPTSNRPTALYRQTRFCAYRCTWDGGGIPQPFTGPTPWPFAPGNTLRFLLRGRSQNCEPLWALLTGTAP